MLTRSQMDKLKDLRSETPEVKVNEPEFFYRVSKDMKNILERSLKEIVDLFDEMPEKSLEKIDLYAGAINCLELLAKLVARLGPAPRAGDEVLRYFRVQVENPLPGVVLLEDDKPTIRVAVTYKPNDSEKEFVEKLLIFIEHADRMIHFNEEGIAHLPQEEFNKKLKALKDKTDLKVSILGPVEGARGSS